MISIEELDKLPYPTKIEAIGLTLLEPFTASHKHHLVKCDVCGHEWKTTLISKISAYKKYQTSGCPTCHKTRKDLKGNASNREAIESKGFVINDDNITIKQLTTQIINVTNTTCGHTFDTSSGNLMHRNVSCPICAKEANLKKLQAFNIDRFRDINENKDEWEKYRDDCRNLTKIVYKQNQILINPSNHILGVAGETGAYHLDHIISVKVGFERDIPKELICHVDNLQVIPWEANVSLNTRIKSIPKIFEMYFNVFDLYAFEDFITERNFHKHPNSPFPFCYYNDAINIAVIYCRFDSYSECTQQRLRLTYKAKLFYKQQGIRCIVVFEDEWKQHHNLVKSKIEHILGNNHSLKRIYARKCTILPIDAKQKNKFLDTNHIQGSDDAKVSYGAFFEGELYAVMTFTTPRVFYKTKNYKDNNTWELSRFATDVSVLISGIAGRMLKVFKNEHTWGQIISYADIRWSEGNMYNKLGFDFAHINPPGYHYIVDGERRHRWMFRKDALKTWDNYDSNKTEFQMTAEKGYSRIWDCGTMLFILKKPQ